MKNVGVRERRATRRVVVAAALVTSLLAGVTGPAAAVAPPSAWRVTSQSPGIASWYATTYAAGRFVVVGHGSSVAVSRDATHWSLHAAPAGAWQSVAFGDGRFVALSVATGAPEEMISSDGVHWSALPGPVGEWTGVAFGAGRFVAVSAQGQFITSSDGVHWAVTWVRSQFLLNSITFGAGRFIAVDSGDGDALISLDGVHWSFYPISVPGAAWFAVSYGNGVFSAFSPQGLAATSMLGYVWVVHRTNTLQQMNASTFGCGTFVATGQVTGHVNEMITSHSATSWNATAVPTDATADWTGVGYGDLAFVAVDSAGTIATRAVSGYCGPTVATPPNDVSGNVASGQVWTYQHPPTSPGGAPVDGYLVTVTDGTRAWTCHASVDYQPNCVIRGLANGVVYSVSTQAHNRFGYSAPTDPQWLIAVAHWTLQARSPAPVVRAGQPLIVQVTGVVANAEGIYPQSPITVHVGARILTCVASPFGECLLTVADPPLGRAAVWASYAGYGVSYRSAPSWVTVLPGA